MANKTHGALGFRFAILTPSNTKNTYSSSNSRVARFVSKRVIGRFVIGSRALRESCDEIFGVGGGNHAAATVLKRAQTAVGDHAENAVS